MDYQVEYVHSPDGTSIAVGHGGDGPPLVVVPYMAATIETSWAACAEAFPGRRVITYDRRGTGLSARGIDTRERDPYLQDAQAVVDGLALDEFAVLGTLLGTIEAAWLAANNPDRVTQLVLRSPLMCMSDWGEIPGVRAAIAALEHDWEYFTESFSQFVVGWGKPNARQLAARYRSVTTQTELRALLGAFASIDLGDVYGGIRAQTLVEHHPEYFFPNSYSQRIASAIPSCRVAVFRGADFLNDLTIATDFLSQSRAPRIAPGTGSDAEEPVRMLAGALAHRYRIDRELGAGGMAVVYLARDLRHEREVAIKVLRPELALAVGVERFVHEIRVTAKLQHPNILPLFDSGAVGSQLYYVMPYVQGETLRQLLTREGQLAVSDAVRIAREVADALRYAHDEGVIHRDIKPENILLRDGRVLVADFGIALTPAPEAAQRLTQTGFSIGTPEYMSPEQALADRDLDGRSDLYSLGCVLFEMLCGRPPHTAASPQAVVARVLTAAPPAAEVLRPSVPPRLASALSRVLSTDRDQRFATAAELLTELVEA